MDSAFSLEEIAVTDTVVLVVHGELDAVSAPEIVDALRRHRAQAARVIVDLRAVTFMDSTGLAAIAINASGSEPQAPVQIIAPTLAQPVRLFELTGLDRLLIDAEDAAPVSDPDPT